MKDIENVTALKHLMLTSINIFEMSDHFIIGDIYDISRYLSEKGLHVHGYARPRDGFFTLTIAGAEKKIPGTLTPLPSTITSISDAIQILREV